MAVKWRFVAALPPFYRHPEGTGESGQILGCCMKYVRYCNWLYFEQNIAYIEIFLKCLGGRERR